MKKLVLTTLAAIALLIPTTLSADARWINGVWYPNHAFSAVVPAPAPYAVGPYGVSPLVTPYGVAPVVAPYGYPHRWHHVHRYRRVW
jgi:hypothetical protein